MFRQKHQILKLKKEENHTLCFALKEAAGGIVEEDLDIGFVPEILWGGLRGSRGSHISDCLKVSSSDKGFMFFNQDHRSGSI